MYENGPKFHQLSPYLINEFQHELLTFNPYQRNQTFIYLTRSVLLNFVEIDRPKKDIACF